MHNSTSLSPHFSIHVLALVDAQVVVAVVAHTPESGAVVLQGVHGVVDGTTRKPLLAEDGANVLEVGHLHICTKQRKDKSIKGIWCHNNRNVHILNATVLTREAYGRLVVVPSPRLPYKQDSGINT